ncbi:MAG: protein arginine kinase [Chlamydiota bacterium]
MEEQSHLPESILSSIPWDHDANTIWPATSFFLHRNIMQYPFPLKLNENSSSQLLLKLKEVCEQIPDMKTFSYLPAELLTAQEKEFLSEHFLSPEGWQNISKGQAFIVDPSGQFLGLLNAQDHLTLQWIDCKGDWEKAWAALNTIEMAIGEQLDFAFSSRFGYLTSDPKWSGTGLVVSCYLHLPCLIASGQLTQLLLTHTEPSVSIAGMLGTMDELLGDFLILKNNYTLGLTEQTILRDLHLTATKLILSERAQRIKYQENASADIKDAISRAYGLLIHSYQLETKEALDAISKIKLGIDLGWIKGMPDKEINEMFFRCRKAHLEQTHKEAPLDKKELAHTRAEYLHNRLKQTTLAF